MDDLSYFLLLPFALFGVPLILYIVFQFIPEKIDSLNFDEESNYGRRIEKENNWIIYSIIIAVAFFVFIGVIAGTR